jgi:hypothetical protein
MYYGIVYGLMSFLMASVFPFIFILGIGIHKLSVNSKMYWINALLVLLSVSLSFQSVIFFGLSDDVIVFLYGIESVVNLWYVLLFLLFSIYLIGFFDLNDTLKVILGSVVSLTLGVKLALLVLFSSGPILGSLLASGNDNSIEFGDYIKGSCIAICFGVVIILSVSKVIDKKFKEKTWSTSIPKLLGIYLFISQISVIIKFFNV